MAKKTKDSNLSLEERLEQALIPNWDEPYKLPDNWCWIHWGNCGQFIAGGAFKEKYQGFLGLPIPFYKVGSLKYSDNNGYLYDETNTIDEEIRNQLKVSLIPVNSIIFAKIGEAIRLNRRSLNTSPCCIDNNLMAFVASDKCYYKYAYYWSKNIDLYEYANATTVPAIRKSDLESIPFPLAPYETQVKIVNNIESLFSKLDEAKEKAQEVVDGFETRKAAILHKAFSGELTAKWREENGVFLDEWEHLTLDDVADYKKGPFGSSITKAMFVPKAENTYKVYEQGNAIRKTLDYGSYYISQKKYEELKGFAIQPGDIIVSCAGTIGEIYKLPNNCEPGVINQALMRVRVYSNINEMYFIHYFTGVLKGDVIDEANGTAIKNIPPFKVLKAMNILLPSLFEQKEIVDILERMLSKEQQAKETAEAVIEQIDTMKKAILARAFRGELGTNDPSEESAVELLKKIFGKAMSSQIGPEKSGKRISIPADIRALISNVREEEIVKLLLRSESKTASVQSIMALSSKKFELMEALRTLDKKQIIKKNEAGEYSLKR